MKNIYDLAVIGAGPSGLAAAASAAAYGLNVMLLDEQPSPGGLIYRNIEKVPKSRIELLGTDYTRGKQLVDRFRRSHADYLGESIVWKIEPEGNIFFSRNGNSCEIRTKKIVIATGAMERPVPFPGWTLPGVMGAAALDANFKSSGTIPQGPVVLAGSGPLLLLTTVHLIKLGVEIKAVLDTTPDHSFFRSIRYLPAALKRVDYLYKGLTLLAELKKSGIPLIRGVLNYKALGKEKVESIHYQTKSGSGSFEAKILLCHEGVIPRTDFSRQLHLPHLWNPVQRYWHPQTNPFGKTGEEHIYVCGDGAFVHGGISAEIKGRLAAIDIAYDLAAVTATKRQETLHHLENELRLEHHPRPFIDEMYRPRPSLYKLADDVMVCRCEGVRVQDIRTALDDGCRDVNEIKAMTRCGMGPCQSRMCGVALAEIVADYLDTDPGNIAPLSIRPPVRNLLLSELAEMSFLQES